MQPKALKIRAKKLGVLMYDARLATRRSVEECARTMDVSAETCLGYESGLDSPSLPELEALAYFLEIPLEHFWSSQSLSEKPPRRNPIPIDRLLPLRQRMVGALLRQARARNNLTLNDIALKTNLGEETIRSYELGEKRIPLPELELLATASGAAVGDFFDQNGPVGIWQGEQAAVASFLELPTDLRDFVCKPINRPYVELALRLSELSVERLRAIAEGILEITY